MNIQQILLIVGISLTIVPLIQLSSSLLMSKRERNLFEDICSREFNEWVIIDPAHYKTYPEDGCEVLLFFACFDGYDVGYCKWIELEHAPSSNGIKVLSWYVGGKLMEDMYHPVCWQKIDTSHEKA